MNIYDFTARDIDGNEVNLQKFKGKSDACCKIRQVHVDLLSV